MINLLNNFQFCVVMRHSRNTTSKGTIHKRYKTLEEAKLNAKELNESSKDINYWAMPIENY